MRVFLPCFAGLGFGVDCTLSVSCTRTCAKNLHKDTRGILLPVYHETETEKLPCIRLSMTISKVIRMLPTVKGIGC